MIQRKTFSGDPDSLTQQVYNDMLATGTHDYHAILSAEEGNIELNIVSSPGGNVEGGYEQTILLSELPVQTNFRFAIYPEDFLNRLGKIFGSQDVKIGYPEFDEKVIVKTNDEVKLKSLFADAEIRQLFETLSGYSFHIDKHKEREGDHLHLVIQRAITNAAELQKILYAFTHALKLLSGTSNGTYQTEYGTGETEISNDL